MLRWLIVPVLALGVSCSSPLRETSEPSQPTEQPAAPEQASAAELTPPTPPPARLVEEPAVAPPEITAQPAAAEAAPEEPPKPPREPVAPDPLKALFAEEERRVEREQTIARLAAERDAAAAAVLQREKDLLAMKNPFLPRPRLAADESAELKGLGGAARARWAERKVAEAKALLETAQKAYDAAKAGG